MKKLLLFNLLITSASMFGQLSIGTSDMKWSVGNELYANSYAKTEKEIDTAKGTGKTWDFSKFVNPIDSDTVKVVTSGAGIKLESSVIMNPTFTLAGSDYSQTSLMGYTLTPAIGVGLPHTYGKKWNNATQVLIVTANISSEIIGEGTIKLPNGVTESVLMQKQYIDAGSLGKYTFYYWESTKYGRLAYYINGKLYLMFNNNFLPINNNNNNSANVLSAIQLNIYPNPTSGYLNIVLDDKIKSVELYNTLGNRISISSSIQLNKIDVSDLSKGLYFINVVGEQKTYTTSFIKK